MTASPEAAADLGARLLDWYHALGRDMPWRGHPDPYAVWVSEIMLQQTTVAAVAPRYPEFLRRFPDVSALADAPEEEVLTAVAGLGYYRRFRALHKAARVIRDERGGVLPRDAASWRELPGIGDYTAAAIAAIGYGERAGAVDGNVTRVLARLDARAGRQDGVRARRVLAARVLELMPDSAVPGDFTQALFDLGREVCTPRDPNCEGCPWSDACLAHAAGETDRFPEPSPRAQTEERLVAQALIICEGRALLRRRPEAASRMPGFWEFPEAWGSPEADPAELLGELLETPVQVEAERARARHAITRYRLDCRLFEISHAALDEGEDAWWAFEEIEASAQPLSTITRKLLRAYLRSR